MLPALCFTPSPTHQLTHHSPTHPLTHSPTHQLNHSPTHSLTHSLTKPYMSVMLRMDGKCQLLEEWKKYRTQVKLTSNYYVCMLSTCIDTMYLSLSGHWVVASVNERNNYISKGSYRHSFPAYFTLWYSNWKQNSILTTTLSLVHIVFV